MAELLGFERNDNGNVVAVVHYPNARTFSLSPYPHGYEVVAKLTPKTERLDEHGIDNKINQCVQAGQDPGFFIRLAAQIVKADPSNTQSPTSSPAPIPAMKL